MSATPIFMALLLVMAVVFDAVIIAKFGAEESISAYLIQWSYEFPATVFFAGFVCGHLFWRMKSNKRTKAIDDISRE